MRKFLSCIVEITVPLDETSRILGTLKEVCKTVDTVISIGVSTVCDNQGNDAVKDILIQEGYEIGWAKLNLGLGRVTNAYIQ